MSSPKEHIAHSSLPLNCHAAATICSYPLNQPCLLKSQAAFSLARGSYFQDQEEISHMYCALKCFLTWPPLYHNGVTQIHRSQS